MLGQCQGKIKVGCGMLGVGLGMVLPLSVNMVVSTINLPLKKIFPVYMKVFDVIGYYILKRTSFAHLFKVNYSFNSESKNFFHFFKSNHLGNILAFLPLFPLLPSC